MTEYTDEEYFGELKLLFQSKGWEMLVDDFERNFAVIDDVKVIKDVDDLKYRQGQLAVLGYLINLEDQVRREEADKESQE